MRSFLFFLLVTFSTVNTLAQTASVTLSGTVKDTKNKAVLPFVNVTLLTPIDSTFVTGVITNEEGLFSIAGVKPGNYLLKVTYIGYRTFIQPLLLGQLSEFLNIGTLELVEEVAQLGEVVVTAQQETIASTMDKKTFTLAENISQAGGSALEAMKNLPGVTVGDDGQVQLRGSSQVMILIDGKLVR